MPESAATSSVLPLEGIRVIDFTQITLGPIATQMLGDFGADVIKIERPDQGDFLRTTLPAPHGDSFIFLAANRNKRAVTLDLRSTGGKQIVERLLRWGDVLAHNFRPGAMEKLGLGYDQVRAVNPRLIYAVGTGYGLTGPYQQKGGQDWMAQALAGGLYRRSDDEAPPYPYGTAVADFGAGMLLTQAILMALIARERTGRGQMVSTSLLDAMLYMQQQEHTAWLNARQRVNWNQMPLNGVYKTSDGKWVLMVGAFKSDPLGDISRGLNLGPLTSDPRYANEGEQKKHRPELQAIFRKRFAELTQAEAIAQLESVDILCAPIRDVGDALTDEQVRTNDMLIDVPHKRLGTFTSIGNPIKMSETPMRVRRAPPDHGEHNDEVLRELGFSDDDIARLRREGAL